ncbi:MAG: CinA family protein [Streptosporangiaceae bacterium]
MGTDDGAGRSERDLAGEAHRLLRDRGATVAVAESLTGGLLGAVLTQVPGSSTTFRGGVTAYATDLKASLLGVSRALLAERGAVDADVASAMAAGASERLGATYGLALTGVAGPEPQDGRPPGTVYVALVESRGEADPAASGPVARATASPRLTGDRLRVRHLAVVHALDLLCGHLKWPRK